MIACFQNLVGIRTACGDQTVSDSGYYVQDLPYVNLKLADALVTDQDSGDALLRQLYSNAVNYLINDVRTRMQPYFKRESILENNIAGYPPLAPAVIPGVSGLYKGIQFQVRQWPYLDLFIPSITLWLDHSGDVDLEVWNLSTGKKLDTITVTTVAGEPTILPETYKNYPSNGQTLNLFIGYNSTGINSYQTNIYNSVLPGYSAGSCRSCLNTFSNRFGNKYVWLFSRSLPVSGAKVQTSLKSVNDTGGLSITYALNCSLDKWLCTMRNQYAFGLLQRWGMEILREAQMSSRLNSLVVLNKDEKEKLYAYFEEEYNKAMQNSFRNLRLPNDVCFYCNSHLLTGIAYV